MRIAQAPRTTRRLQPATAPQLRRAPDPMLAEVLAGLERRPRSIPSRYFYDERGTRLFQWISNLPDYYLTRVERQILAARGAAMVAPLLGAPCTVVDLGAGDGHKTRILLELLTGRVPKLVYAPVDVSPSALDEASERIRGDLAGVAIRPVQAGYGEATGACRHPRAATSSSSSSARASATSSTRTPRASCARCAVPCGPGTT